MGDQFVHSGFLSIDFGMNLFITCSICGLVCFPAKKTTRGVWFSYVL
jgi:hypothetical protein